MISIFLFENNSKVFSTIFKKQHFFYFLWPIVQWENEQNRWKMNNNSENTWNQLFLNDWKKTERNGPIMSDVRTKWKKPNSPISSHVINRGFLEVKPPSHLEFSDPASELCHIASRNPNLKLQILNIETDVFIMMKNISSFFTYYISPLFLP